MRVRPLNVPAEVRDALNRADDAHAAAARAAQDADSAREAELGVLRERERRLKHDADPISPLLLEIPSETACKGLAHQARRFADAARSQGTASAGRDAAVVDAIAKASAHGPELKELTARLLKLIGETEAPLRAVMADIEAARGIALDSIKELQSRPSTEGRLTLAAYGPAFQEICAHWLAELPHYLTEAETSLVWGNKLSLRDAFVGQCKQSLGGLGALAAATPTPENMASVKTVLRRALAGEPDLGRDLVGDLVTVIAR